MELGIAAAQEGLHDENNKKKKVNCFLCVTSGVPLRSSMSSNDSQARSTFWWSGAGGAFLDLELL
jgi:hypothetical protein